MRSEPARMFPSPTVAGKTDTGRVRNHNEDNVLLLPEQDVHAVADGVGGHGRGDVASALSIAALKMFFSATAGKTRDVLSFSDTHPPTGARRLVSAIRWANQAIWEVAHVGDRFRDMGTTLVATHFSRTTGLLYIAHVGDSRCYRIRDGLIEPLTIDHSLRNDARKTNPSLSEDAVAKLPRNVVTRALGLDRNVKIDVRAEPVQYRDTYLLCSDGLSQMVPDADILGVLMVTQSLQKACERLIAMANDAGGTDNISVVLVGFEQPSPAYAAEGSLPPGQLWPDVQYPLLVELQVVEESSNQVSMAVDSSAAFEQVHSKELFDDQGPDITIEGQDPPRL